MKKNNDEIA